MDERTARALVEHATVEAEDAPRGTDAAVIWEMYRSLAEDKLRQITSEAATQVAEGRRRA